MSTQVKIDARQQRITALKLDHNRDAFFVSMISEIADVLQSIIGVENAAGFVTTVADNIGSAITRDYTHALKIERLSKDVLADVLVDLKRRISGDFYVIEETEDRIVLGNRRCPYGKMVQGKPALCMMTSDILGRVASSSTSYAKVHLAKTIANYAPGCEIIIYLKPTEEARQAPGIEYFDDELELIDSKDTV